MKVGTIGLLLIFLLLYAVSVLPQNKDLAGTWIGATIVPNSPDKDIITMVIKKAGESYAGTISDSLGMVNNASLADVKFESGALNFGFVAVVDSQEIKVSVTLKISGEKLVGSWESEDGATGELEMARVK